MSARRSFLGEDRALLRFARRVMTLYLLGRSFLPADLMAAGATPASPIRVSAALESREGPTMVRFSFELPPEHVVYADRLKFEAENGTPLLPSRIPEPVIARDQVTGHERRMYDQGFQVELTLDSLPAKVVVKLQSCSNSACYFPEKRFFTVTSAGVTADSPSSPGDQRAAPTAQLEAWETEATDFKVTARVTGYLRARDFLAFLDRGQSEQPAVERGIGGNGRVGRLATVLFILLGGIGLNFTPCVLPLIPINLAIIGAGAQSRSRRRGFALGAAYGAGMALAYGFLGLIVVLTGSKFGALNSSPWFNAAMALVFLVLTLAMFDVINVDFSRFRSGGATTRSGRKGPVLVAFSLGAVAALLAGACVAPVVISVLVLSAQLYSQGFVTGLLLTFLLGIGMALPWPFAGAGLTFLPKPGKWMVWIKYGFGAMILLLAAYYGHLSWRLLQRGQHTTSLLAAMQVGGPALPEANESLAQALRLGRQEGRPVFVDFAASWCKNCLAMDETVFNQAAVKERLKDFVVIRYDAERPNESPARRVLDHFAVMGLPTYLILKTGQAVTEPPKESRPGIAVTNRAAIKGFPHPKPRVRAESI